MEEKKYLKWYNKIGYGSGDIAGNVVYAFLTSFMMVYLTDSVGLAAGVVGTLIAVSKLFDGFTDIFFGSMIDKTHSKMGTAAFLKEQAAGCSAFVIGEAGLLNALYDVGITMNDVNPDYVVVGEGRSYSLDTLTKATNLVLKGAKLIGANSDVSGPIENGIAPACRALIAPIEMATGTQAYFCGKPNPLMMRTGLNMLGCHSAEAVMVGDRMDTDVISGMESGMSTVLVLSGCSTKDTLKTYAYLPTMVLNGVGDIASMAKAKEE